MTEINQLNDFDLCKAHSKLKAEIMEHQCAEGRSYFNETDARLKAEKEYEEYDKELEKRGITFDWVHVEDNNFVSLKTGYLKNKICICVA